MRTVYIDTVNGTASPTDPTQSNDAYDTWANMVTGEAAQTDDLTVNLTGTTDLGQITTATLSCASLTVVGEVNTPKWEANKVTVSVTDLSGILQTNSSLATAGSVVFRGLQIDLTITSNVTQAGCYATYPVDLVACIIRRSDSYVNTGGEIRGIVAQTADFRVWNSIIYNIDPAGASAYAYGARRSFADDDFKIYNSIIYNCGTGVQMNSATCALVNCIVGSNDAGYGDLRDALGTIDYNFTIDADAAGANGTQVLNQATMDAYFTDPANGDFTLTAAGQSALAGQGLSDPASGAFSDDITGATRSGAWSVGPLQVVALPVISGANVSATTSQISFEAATDTISGTLYAVADTAGNMAGITEAQIKAGTNANDLTPVAAASAAVAASPETATDTGLSLPNSTTYSFAIVQETVDGYSNILTGTVSTPGLVISSVTGTLTPGSTGTAAVTLAGTTQGTVTLTDGFGTQHNATINSWPTGTGDGDVVFQVPSIFAADLEPGTVTVTVTNSGATDSDSDTATLAADTGWTTGVIVSQNTSADGYLSSTPAPEAGDLVAYESVLRLVSDDSQTAYNVTVVLDGLYFQLSDTVPDGSYYFDYYIYDADDGTWGTSGRQSVTVVADADTIPNQFSLLADVTGAELSTTYSGSFTVSGATPGIDLTATATGSIEISDDDVTFGSSLTVQNGTTVYYRMDSSASYETEVTGTVLINTISDSLSITTRAAAVPTIVTQPSASAVEAGDTVTLSVVATGAASYQWYENDVLVSGETGASYAFTAESGDNGNTYYVILASGEGGTVQSSTVTLSVSTNAAPTITGSSAHTITEGAGFNASYTIANRDGNAPTLSGNDASLFSIVNVSGDTYTLSMTAKDYENPQDSDADNVYEVTITINDLVNAAVTLDITVTVTDTAETFWSYTPPQYRIVRFGP